MMNDRDQLGEMRQLSRSNGSQGEGNSQLIVSFDNRRGDPSANKEALVERYRECQKNHAAAIGGNSRDGCGEFMPSGEEGTPEAFKCSACNCHRNFHRKEIIPFHPFFLNTSRCDENIINLSPTSTILMCNGKGEVGMGEEKETKKRFRTKFTAEQKERMLAFAEKAEWKIHKLEESAVQKFCIETGINKRVLKVWIHNNKNYLANRKSHSSTG